MPTSFVAIASRCVVSVVMLAGPAAAQGPGHEGASTPEPDAAPAPTAVSEFPSTVAPPSAAGPAAHVKLKLDPYALVIGAMSWNAGNSSNNPDLPEWAVEGPSGFFWTARWSRLGLRASWDKPPSSLGAEAVFGLVEMDFNGAFLGEGAGYFSPLPRLRLATATVEWCSVRLSFGQDWSVLAPLNPDTAFHTGLPGFTTSGNLWARIPQLRLDGGFYLGDDTTKDAWRLIWAAALVASAQSDAIPTDQSDITNTRIPEGGELSLVPAGEARIALGGPLFGRTFEVGVSGHLGDRKIPFTGGTERQLNGAVALDLTLPLPERFELAGEMFWGRGLDAFFGGINQGIAHTTNAAGAITSLGDSIATFGGWGQASWGAVDWLTLYAAGGFDNPHDNDLLPVNGPTNRTLNTAVYGSVAVELARGFVMWGEYDFLRTTFEAAPTVHAHTVSLTGALSL